MCNFSFVADAKNTHVFTIAFAGFGIDKSIVVLQILLRELLIKEVLVVYVELFEKLSEGIFDPFIFFEGKFKHFHEKILKIFEQLCVRLFAFKFLLEVVEYYCF